MIGPDEARACLRVFLETEFQGGRHVPRVEKLSNPRAPARRAQGVSNE
jgi:ribose 5-phosphate isomerase RpiB